MAGKEAMATILTAYYRPKPGGFCKRLFRAIEALLSNGHTVHYLAVKPFPISHSKCRFHRFPWPEHHTDTLLFWMVWYAAAPVLLASLAIRYRVSHTFGFSTAYTLLLKPSCWLKSVRSVCFIRGDLLLAHRMKARAPWVIRLETLFEGWALHRSYVVAVSDPILRTILQRHPNSWPLGKEVIPNDLPQNSLKSHAHNHIDNTGALNIAFAGVLEPSKNVMFLLDLMTLLPTGKFSLSVFGTGPLQAHILRKIDLLDLGEHVRCMGWVPSETIWQSTDILMAPSVSEGMPNAVLEAVANRIPVLASDIPAHREILPRDQLLSFNRPKQWVQTLMKLSDLSGAELAEFQRRQLHFLETFDFDWNAKIVQAIVGCSR